MSGSGRRWFCLRAHPKHEHIAAGHLRLLEGVEVFNPRIRSRKWTKRGAVWVTDSLFPNYLFSRFDAEVMFEQVRFLPGVSTIVHFGNKTPTVPDAVVGELKTSMDHQELLVLEGDFVREGDEVEFTWGAFRGLNARVLAVLPGKERVRILLDMLGRDTAVEVDIREIHAARTRHREAVIAR
jgi:transcriptional antiterminator RfaH